MARGVPVAVLHPKLEVSDVCDVLVTTEQKAAKEILGTILCVAFCSQRQQHDANQDPESHTTHNRTLELTLLEMK